MNVFDQEWTAHGLPIPENEYQFHATRKWRFDYAWPVIGLAVEIEGIFYRPKPGIKSRHQTGSGYAEDCTKYNAANEMGWTILRYQPKKIDWLQVKRVYDKLIKVRSNKV
jgi:hypothetical protein